MQGQIAWLQGDYERAIASQKRALVAGRASGYPFLEAAALCGLGTAYLDVGADYADRGSELHAQAMEVMEHPMGTVMGAMIWADLGFCAMAMGEFERAEHMFHKGLTVSTATKFPAKPPLLIGSAFLELGRDNRDQAAKLVEEAREFVEDRQMKHFFPLIALAEAQVTAAEGKSPLALEHLTRGERLALEMRMRPKVLQARLGAVQLLAA